MGGGGGSQILVLGLRLSSVGYTRSGFSLPPSLGTSSTGVSCEDSRGGLVRLTLTRLWSICIHLGVNSIISTGLYSLNSHRRFTPCVVNGVSYINSSLARVISLPSSFVLLSLLVSLQAFWLLLWWIKRW